MTMMPRGTPRSVPDPVGQAYEERLRLWNAKGRVITSLVLTTRRPRY